MSPMQEMLNATDPLGGSGLSCHTACFNQRVYQRSVVKNNRVRINGCEVGLLLYGDASALLDEFVTLAVFRCWGGGADGTVRRK